MKKFIIILIVFTAIAWQAQSQGCVAVRSTGGTVCTRANAGNDNTKGWQLITAYRYFRSFRHFRGEEEEKNRVEQNTEVINKQHSMDIALIRRLNSRWSFALNVPVLSNFRSSRYEHGGNSGGPEGRHSTNSFGIGDIRLTAYHWLFDPAKSRRGNIQVGLGIKLPTGDYQYQDFFIKNDSTKLLGYVDQSIQLGDGGTGFTTEINAYYNFSSSFGVYGNFYYLVNPREHNGVNTFRGGDPRASSIAYGSSVMSAPDQYMIRLGGAYMVNRFTASAGFRMECVPVHDLIGGSSGFRRPGYIISVEPGVSYQLNKVLLFASVPVALERNRTQSVPDKVRTELTGNYAQGDAAFADYLINVGATFNF